MAFCGFDFDAKWFEFCIITSPPAISFPLSRSTHFGVLVSLSVSNCQHTQSWWRMRREWVCGWRKISTSRYYDAVTSEHPSNSCIFYVVQNAASPSVYLHRFAHSRCQAISINYVSFHIFILSNWPLCAIWLYLSFTHIDYATPSVVYVQLSIPFHPMVWFGL